MEDTIPYRPLRRRPSSPPSLMAPPASSLPARRLHMLIGPQPGQSYLLAKPDLLVGRSRACDIQILDPQVSRRHFRLRHARGTWFLQDQASSGGTFVNDKPVKAIRLQSGDEIRIGQTLLRFEVDDAPSFS